MTTNGDLDLSIINFEVSIKSSYILDERAKWVDVIRTRWHWDQQKIFDLTLGPNFCQWDQPNKGTSVNGTRLPNSCCH